LKLITGILFIYLIVLITTPCVDIHPESNFQHIELSQSTTGGEHHHADLCSPFCTCNCCVSPIIHQDIIMQLNHFLRTQDYNAGYTISFISPPFIAFWQPPKIS
jgi:hypothetical protein